MSEKRKEIIREWSEIDTALRPEILDKWTVTPPEGYLETLEDRLLDTFIIENKALSPEEKASANTENQDAGGKMISMRTVIIGIAAVMCCVLAALVLLKTGGENDVLQIDDETALLYLEEDLADWEVADLVYADVLEDHQVYYDDISLEAEDLENLEEELFDEELLAE